MEYYGGALCVSYDDLVDRGIMSMGNIRQMSCRGKLSVVRKGGNGRCALIAVDSLPERYRSQVRELMPEGTMAKVAVWVKKHYERDAQAYAFFFDKEMTGVTLPPEKILEYTINASVLNACIKLYDRATTCQKMFGMRYDWDKMAQAIEALQSLYGHTLPTSTQRLRKKVAEYKRNGYSCLISGKFGNQSSRKVNAKILRLIRGIAAQPEKPWNKTVWELYNMFVRGEYDVWDKKTGELFQPSDFTDKDGEPLELSESTVARYLNMQSSRILIDKKHMTQTTYMHEVMPHVHRHAPEYSLSKISFDDRDLPRKLKDTKMRPKAYYAYDVASQCVVGVAYNRYKTVDLVVDCFRSMFRLIEQNGWGCPAQVEVENHLMSQWRESFLKAGVVFPFVRFCAPQNSQEKYAEQMNGAKKRSIEHRNHIGIGRFYAKDRHYRTEAKKVFDALNDTYEDKTYYTWEELIADDQKDVMEFNHSLHPNQKKYPGMTRWEVLVENMNPSLPVIDKALWARYIGEKISTSIRRNSYCRVQGKDWWLSTTAVIEQLEPNNVKVEAYCLTNENGEATDVWIWQNDRMLDKLEDVGTFNTAQAEQTEEDHAIFEKQQRKIHDFMGYVKRNEVDDLEVSGSSDTVAEYEEPLESDGNCESCENDGNYGNYESDGNYGSNDPIADI